MNQLKRDKQNIDQLKQEKEELSEENSQLKTSNDELTREIEQLKLSLEVANKITQCLPVSANTDHNIHDETLSPMDLELDNIEVIDIQEVQTLHITVYDGAMNITTPRIASPDHNMPSTSDTKSLRFKTVLKSAGVLRQTDILWTPESSDAFTKYYESIISYKKLKAFFIKLS